MNTELMDLLHEIARVLSRYGVKAYAVSGVVRDCYSVNNVLILISLYPRVAKMGYLLKKELGGKLETYSEYENAVWYTYRSCWVA